MSTQIAGTKVRIQGQEERSFANFDMTVEQVRASFQSSVDLSSMNVAESLESNWKVLTFTPRTGTKGAIAGTKVRIQGQEERSFANFDMTVEQVRASFQSSVDLSSMNVAESLESNWKVLTFTPRTGTKGAIAGTKVRIQGQEERSFANFDMTVEQVRASFQSSVDLSSMNVAESLESNWKVLTFTPRTGTKGC